jgi:anti-anti-sigma regulatory factor
MLKITMGNTADGLRFELEGRLAGAWVAELEECWRTAAPAANARGVWIDLTGVEYVDAAGRYLLALMHKSGARFIAPGCLMGALVEDIQHAWR